MPIAYKLALIISLFSILSIAVVVLVITRQQTTLLSNTVNNYGEALSRQLATAAKDNILTNNRLALEVLLQDLVQNEDIQGAAIMDSNYNALSSRGYLPKQEFYRQQLIALMQEHKSGKVQVLKWQDYDEHQHLMLLNTYIYPVTLKDLTLGHAVVTLSNHNLNQLLKSFSTSIAIIALVTIFLSIVIAVYISKRISRPIDNIMDASQQIEEGNLEFRLDEQRSDELGKLMRSLNSMADGLVQKREVEKTFSRFVSENIANEILANLDNRQLTGKQTEASVMFADIVGFTTLSESLPPADVATLLNEYFTEVSAIATEYHGSINKYVGDCVMVIFGTPIDDPQHSLHACLCALAIRDRIQGFNEERRRQGLATVEFRIGINSGTMLAGTLGAEERMEYTVIGDNVNLASRLADLAGANEILVPAGVLEQASILPRFTTYEKGRIEIRGKRNKVVVVGINATVSPTAVFDHAS